MPEPVTPATGDSELAAVRRTLDQIPPALASVATSITDHTRMLAQQGAANTPPPAGSAAGGGASDQESLFIMAMDDPAYAMELHAMLPWVDEIFIKIYGPEVSPVRPWCVHWYEHPEAVARIHGLWLAWQQMTHAESGHTGPAVWHRDYLDPALARLRAPDGPFAACSTSPDRPNHRLLAAPTTTDTAGLDQFTLALTTGLPAA